MPFPDHIPEPGDLAFGQDALLDAWLNHFMTQNNLDHALNPHLNASFEQLRFMVDIDPGQVFFPCSEKTMRLILSEQAAPELLGHYNQVWQRSIRLIKTSPIDEYARKMVIQSCRYRFRSAWSEHVVIPSRLQKRMASLVRTRSNLDDPLREHKKNHNRQAREFVDSPCFDHMLNAAPDLRPNRLDQMLWDINALELRRLLTISTLDEAWKAGAVSEDLVSLEQRLENLGDLKPLSNFMSRNELSLLTILYLPDASGEIVLDLQVINFLLRHGCKVILALKDSFDFYRTTLADLENDPVLADGLKKARVVYDDAISKNGLLHDLGESRFLVISDGQCESTNLYRASVTFARAWKEADVVIAKGVDNYRRFMKNPARFTRDIVCFYRYQGIFRYNIKKKSERIRKFSSADLSAKAEDIITAMRRAKAEGRTVMFYSAIVGSVPGQTQVAIKLLDVFVNYLRVKIDHSYIINPAEYFEPGLDGDDLMFMWEKVQRSGLLDIWRFQSTDDIEKSFELLGEKVPPVWAGKDATFSTGCTKEMKIALDMQTLHRELQIIGPSPDKFFRRRDYGVGRYFDSLISS